jgi:DinB superfamily
LRPSKIKNSLKTIKIRMTKQFDITRMYRTGFINLIKDLPIEVLNDVPKGFNNNLVWNLGHVLVTQQALCYRLCQLPMPLTISEDFFKSYMRGTKPEKFIEAAEVAFILEELVITIDTMEKQYHEGFFKDYQPYNLRANLPIPTIEDAIGFNATHEALHYGTALAIKKLVLSA